MQEKLHLGLIGYGGMGSYHLHTLIPKELFEINGIYDIDVSKRVKAQENGFTVYETVEALVADPMIDVILIATPNDSHCELAIQALQAKKHVICEKPVMMTTKELDQVLATAKQEDRQFIVHQNRRWDEDFLAVKEMYHTKKMGEIFQIESRVQGANGIPGDWRHEAKHGGGMLLDWGVHLLDQLLYMIDAKVTSVMADLSFVLGNEVDDGFLAYLYFEDGTRAVVEVGTTNFTKLPRWYVKGYEGTMRIDDWDLSGEIVSQTGTIDHHHLIPIKAGAGLTKTMAPPSEEATTRDKIKTPTKPKESFYENVYQVLVNGKEPIVKNDEIRRVLSLIERLFEAHEQRQILSFES